MKNSKMLNLIICFLWSVLLTIGCSSNKTKIYRLTVELSETSREHTVFKNQLTNEMFELILTQDGSFRLRTPFIGSGFVPFKGVPFSNEKSSTTIPLFYSYKNENEYEWLHGTWVRKGNKILLERRVSYLRDVPKEFKQFESIYRVLIEQEGLLIDSIPEIRGIKLIWVLRSGGTVERDE